MLVHDQSTSPILLQMKKGKETQDTWLTPAINCTAGNNKQHTPLRWDPATQKSTSIYNYYIEKRKSVCGCYSVVQNFICKQHSATKWVLQGKNIFLLIEWKNNDWNPNDLTVKIMYHLLNSRVRVRTLNYVYITINNLVFRP